jgi:hypothetical protein
MTIDNSVIFDITDITNIQFECKKCKARFATSLSEWKTIVNQCPNCYMPWLKSGGNLQQYVGWLRDTLIELAKPNKDNEFLIRFEVRSASGHASGDKD